MRTVLTSLAMAVILGGSAEGAATAPLSKAFVVAFGRPGPVTRVIERPLRPPGCNCSGNGSARVSLTVTPDALIPLGGGRFALVSMETDDFGAHADPGALSIAYLDNGRGRWRLDHLWNEIAWTGDDGHPADHLITRRRRGAAPLVFAIHDALHQGEHDTTAWVIALRSGRPQALGHFPFGGSLQGNNGCEFASCGAYAYRAAISRTGRHALAFTVAYRGWREPPSGHARIALSERTEYRVRGNALVVDQPPRLPVG